MFTIKNVIVFAKYLEIFSQPSFWIMAIILVSVIYTVYRYFVYQNEGYSEEEEAISNYLATQQLQYLSSETPENTSTATPYNYRKVQVKNAQGETLSLLVRIGYRKGVLSSVHIQP